MKRLLFMVSMVFFVSWTCVAQTSANDTPATKEDVENYLQVVHSHDMLKKMAGAMTPAMHKLMHEQYLKHKDDLPADYETKINAMMDDMLANMPWDEMMDSMTPIYQKHFTKGDINSLIVFYSSPTGEKILREMPAIMSEAMQNMMPVMSKYMETVQQRLMKETEVMIAQSKKLPNANTSVTHN